MSILITSTLDLQAASYKYSENAVLANSYFTASQNVLPITDLSISFFR